MQSMMTSRLVIGAAASTLAALVLTAVPANVQAFGGWCTLGSTSQPFRPWLDLAQYALAPNGDLEARKSPWALKGGARVVRGNEPFHVGGETDAASLRLPAGGSATTAPMCVGLGHPTVRLFAKRSAGSLLGSLKVEALFTDAAQHARAVPIGVIFGYTSWAPTSPLPIVINMISVTGDTVEVRFRFTSSASSAWLIDDVYVDPYRTN